MRCPTQSSISNTLESVAYCKNLRKNPCEEVVYILETNQLMNPNQHGVRAHRSCLSQLISHYELIITASESKCYADVIHIDFTKTFDRVDHGILLKKMKKMNVSGELAVDSQFSLRQKATSCCRRNSVRGDPCDQRCPTRFSTNAHI